jgi:hypothetical protein
MASWRLKLFLLVASLGLGVGVTAATLAVPAGASTAAALREGASGSLQLNAKFGGGYRLDASCPAGTPATTDECVPFLGGADVRGLGHVIETYTKSFDGTICPGRMVSHPTAVLEITGKGTIEVAMEPWPTCSDSANSTSPNGVTALLEGRIVRGTQKFAGALGSLKVTNHLDPPSCGTDGCQGSATDTWTGTLVVPDFEFDLTPPVLRGAAPKSVTAPRKAKFLRVRYSVTAQDAVDRSVPASCQPASSGRFKIGRTKVTCTAKDSSANVATATFTVTVTRRP